MFLVTSLPLFWASSSSEHISFHWPLCYLFLHLLDHSLPESPLPARCILDHRQHWPIPPSASFCWSSQSMLRDYAQEGSVPLQVQGALRRALGTWQFLLFFSRRLFRELSDFSSFLLSLHPPIIPSSPSLKPPSEVDFPAPCQLHTEIPRASTGSD